MPQTRGIAINRAMDLPIIRLGREHKPQAVAALAAAFQNDPAVSWIMPDPVARARRLLGMYDWLYDEHLEHGVILGTAGGEAVTLWRAPGKVHYHEPIWHPALAWRLLGIFGPTVLRASRVGDAIDASVPKGEDWYYLKYAGVRPDCQGKGLGGRTIRAGLALAREAGVAALLETATESNVGIYLRLGFAVTHEWDVPGKGAPHFWSMRCLHEA